MARGFCTRYLYPPAKTIRIPEWIESEVREFVTRREVERFREEVGTLEADLELYRRSQRPQTNKAKKFAAKKNKGAGAARTSRK